MDPIKRYFLENQRVLAEMPQEPIERMISLLYEAWREGHQVFIMGNGGSASTASHMANDLSKATIVPGMARMKVIALTDNIALITAWANDSSYENVFKEQLENLLETGDLVIGLSASGDSPNILRAVEFSRQHDAVTVGWTGLSGGRLKEVAEHCIHSPTDDIGIIESVHLVLDHLVTQVLRQRIQTESMIWSHVREQKERKVNGGRRRVFPLAASPHI